MLLDDKNNYIWTKPLLGRILNEIDPRHIASHKRTCGESSVIHPTYARQSSQLLEHYKQHIT